MRAILCVLPLMVSACRRDGATKFSPASQPIVIGGEETGTVVARVGAGAITVDELRARIEEAGVLRDRYREPRELRALLDHEIRFELLAAEAQRRGFDRDPEVQEAARKAMVQKMLTRSLGEASSVSDDEVKAFYERNNAEYHQPERVQLELLRFDGAQAAAGARDKLKSGKGDALAYAQLRKELGLESTRDLELKYWSQEELEASAGTELAAAAFAATELGVLGPVVASGGKFYVWKPTGRRPAYHKAINEVADAIRTRLHRQRRAESFDALVRELREETPVTIDEAALRQVFPEPASTPAVKD